MIETTFQTVQTIQHQRHFGVEPAIRSSGLRLFSVAVPNYKEVEPIPGPVVPGQQELASPSESGLQSDPEVVGELVPDCDVRRGSLTRVVTKVGPNEYWGMCSGTWLGGDIVLTAGHCLGPETGENSIHPGETSPASAAFIEVTSAATDAAQSQNPRYGREIYRLYATSGHGPFVDVSIIKLDKTPTNWPACATPSSLADTPQGARPGDTLTATALGGNQGTVAFGEVRSAQGIMQEPGNSDTYCREGNRPGLLCVSMNQEFDGQMGTRPGDSGLGFQTSEGKVVGVLFGIFGGPNWNDPLTATVGTNLVKGDNQFADWAHTAIDANVPYTGIAQRALNPIIMQVDARVTTSDTVTSPELGGIFERTGILPAGVANLSITSGLQQDYNVIGGNVTQADVQSVRSPVEVPGQDTECVAFSSPMDGTVITATQEAPSVTVPVSQTLAVDMAPLPPIEVAVDTTRCFFNPTDPFVRAVHLKPGVAGQVQTGIGAEGEAVVVESPLGFSYQTKEPMSVLFGQAPHLDLASVTVESPFEQSFPDGTSVSVRKGAAEDVYRVEVVADGGAPSVLFEAEGTELLIPLEPGVKGGMQKFDVFFDVTTVQWKVEPKKELYLPAVQR